MGIDWLIIILMCILALMMIRKDHIFAPWSITLLVWIAELGLYVTVDHELFRTKGYFEEALIMWVFTFCISSITVYSIVPKSINKIEASNYNKHIFNAMFLLSIVFVPITAYITYQFVMSNALSDNIFFNLRYYAGEDKREQSILKYITYVALIPLLAECNQPKPRKKMLIILYSLNILMALLSMAKGALFVIIITSIFVLCYNGKVKKTIFIYVFGIFIFLTVLFSGLRSFTGNTEENAFLILNVYILSPIVAFDYVAPNIVPQYDGAYTFRFFYQLLQSFGFDVEVQGTVQEFVRVPLSTNVYTVFFQYYKDFGIFGVAIMGILNGLIYGFVYANINRHPHLKLLYAYFFASLCLQFFNEIFWVTFSIVIQIFIWSYFIYFLKK